MGHVAVRSIDGHVVRGCSCSCLLERPLDIVDRRPLPATAGEGDGVAPGSASRVQNAAGGKRIGALCDRLQFGRGFVRIHGVNPIRYSRS